MFLSAIYVKSGYEVRKEVLYWRKANAIHRWFVEKCQFGVDNCATYYVPREKLEELRELCEAVVNGREDAEETLPTQSGFFFGGIEYDDWYTESLKYTAEKLTEILGDEEISYFEYCSSW